MKQMLLEKLKLKLKSTKLTDTKLKNEKWCKKDFNRQDTDNELKDKPVGVFIVRKSESYKDSYVLSIRVPKYVNQTRVSHYLIIKHKRKYSLKDTEAQYSSIKKLIQHFSYTRDMLPVMLNMDYYDDVDDELNFDKISLYLN